ncbi:MAG: hypothetical protein R3D58_21375 [Saprospiraceae bacterium]|jgi:hypothetical protein|nr:hypothetical protein [Lewinellaceae bacterium]
MKSNILKISAFALLLSLAFTACKKDETTEQEVITTVVARIFAADGSLDQSFEWNDLDGPGGNAPTIDNIILAANKTYNCTIEVYDRSTTPDRDITLEIDSEKAEHLFVYTPDGVNITVSSSDTDENGKPFDRVVVWQTGTASVGSMTVVLKHEPDKDAANPAQTGETDFEVAFPVRIQ